jgi:diacylglycerol kinase
VLTAELFNTAVESLVDIISPHYSKKAGFIKDVAAGAVLIAAVVSVIIGCIIFIPKF